MMARRRLGALASQLRGEDGAPPALGVVGASGAPPRSVVEAAGGAGLSDAQMKKFLSQGCAAPPVRVPLSLCTGGRCSSF